MFYETRKNPKKVSKVLSCVGYTIIINYVCIDYLGSESIKLSELGLGSGGSYKHEETFMKNVGNCDSRSVNEFDVLSWIFEEKDSVVILKFPKRIFE